MNPLPKSWGISRRKRGLAILIAFGALLVLPSCGIPLLRRPDPGQPLPEDTMGTSLENSAQLRIEEFFNDPTLTDLIGQALVGNQELKILAEDIRIANNTVLGRRGAYLPFFTLGGYAGAEKPSQYTRDGAVDQQLNILPGKEFPNPLPSFLLASNLSWQIDIWRQLRNARDAASLRYLGTSDGRAYVVTRLVAELAENYYRLMALDNRIEILDQTIALQEQSLAVARAKKAAARDTELPVQRFLAEVRRNQSEKLIVHQEIIEVENRINFLLGRYPQPVERVSSNFFNLNLHSLRVGVPSQLLRNRPDIRQAERELEASGLDIKVARARFFPEFIITGGVGYSAFNPRYLFVTPEALIANIAGSLVAPLVNKKAIQAEYLTANSRQLQSVYNYQRVILNAYTEVTNRLSKVENYGKSIEIKQLQLQALEESVDVASRLFQSARADYVDVLFAQRDLRDARTVLIDTKQQHLSAIVNTYQALGGGGYLSPLLTPLPLRYEHLWKVKHSKHADGNQVAVRGLVPLIAPPANPPTSPLPAPAPEGGRTQEAAPGLPEPNPKPGSGSDSVKESGTEPASTPPDAKDSLPLPIPPDAKDSGPFFKAPEETPPGVEDASIR